MSDRISPHFYRHEFACRCDQNCGKDTVDTELVELLEEIRVHFDAKTTLNSGHRCKYWNAHEGGSQYSMHLEGKAADIVVEGVSPDEVADFVDMVYPNNYGLGRYNSFTHVDVRAGKARWDNRTS